MKTVNPSIRSVTRNAIGGRLLSTFSLLFLAAWILTGLSTSTEAQTGAAISGQFVTPTGTPAYNAQVFVCAYNATGIPCFPQVPIYSNPALTGTPITQPTATNQYGNLNNVWVANGTTVLIQVRINATVVYSYYYTAGGTGGGGGGGTVTNFTAGNLPPIFTTTVTNPTTTPNLGFTLTNISDMQFLGNVTGSTAAPAYVNFVAGSNMTLTESGGNTLTFASTASGPTIEVNETPISPPSPADFADSASVTWTFSGGKIQATAVPVSALTLQHNGVNLADQTLLNFNDTTPAPPGGFEPVTFQSDGGGDLSGYVTVPTVQNGIEMLVPKPAPPAQQIVLYATACTQSNSVTGGPTTPFVGTCDDKSGTTAMTPNSGGIFWAGGNLQWTNYTLPSFVSQGSITAVYAFMTSSLLGGVKPNYPGGGTGLYCMDGSQKVPVADASVLAPQRLFTSVTFANQFATVPTVANIICKAEVGRSTGSTSTTILNVPVVGLIINYIGTPPPTDTSLQVASPLNYNSSTNTLSLSPLSSISPTAVANLPTTGTSYWPLSLGEIELVSDGSTTSGTCTGGGTIVEWCQWGGSTWTVFSAGGGGTGPTLQTNGVNNASQPLLNFVNPAAFNGLSFAFSNPSGGIETFGITGTLNSAGLTNTGVSPGSYTCMNGTVNAQGQLTAAATGSCSGGGGGTGLAYFRTDGIQSISSQIFKSFKVTSTSTIASSCPGAAAIAAPAYTGGSTPTATGSTVWTLYDATSATTLCSFTWSPAGSVAAVSGTGGTVTSGDTVQIIGAATADATLANVGITIPNIGGGVSGTVTEVDTGTGLTGGPITGTGTISLAPIGADDLLMNATAGSAAPSGVNVNDCSGATDALTYSTSSHAFGCNTLGGISLTVNGGSPLATLNINSSSPAPDASFIALTPKIDVSNNLIIEAPYGTSSAYGVLQCGSGTTCTGGVITVSGGGGMVYPGAGIAVSNGSSWLTSYGAQGTDTNLLTAGTFTGSTGAAICKDANGGATTIGCGAGTVTTTGSPASGDIAAFSSASAITTATATQVNTLLKTLTGCNTSGNVYTPQAADCVTPTVAALAFNLLTSGTNTTAAMLVGTGASLLPTGGGAIGATTLYGGALGSAPYQNSSTSTLFIASPTTSGQTFVYAWQPSGSAVAPTAINLGTYLLSPPPIGTTTPSSGKFSALIVSGNGSASNAALLGSGSLFTGGSGTTTVPYWYINQGTAPTTWSTNGTEFGVNAPSGFTGNFLDFHLNGGTSAFSVNYLGALTTGSGSTACGTATGCLSLGEASTAGSPTSGNDYLRADSIAHQFVYSVNGSAESNLVTPLYSTSGTLQTSPHIVNGSGALSGGTLTVTLTGAAVFTSSSSYVCSPDDSTGVNGIQVTYTSGSSFTLTGTGTDALRFTCVGN